MKKRNVLALLLAISLMVTSFAGCDIQSILSGLTGGTQLPAQTGSEIKDAAAWDVAFENLDWTNFSLDMVRRDNNGETISETNYIFAEDAAWYLDDRDDVYTVKNADGTFTTYRHMIEKNVTLIPNDTGSFYHQRIWDMSAVNLSFAGQFDKFTYDKDSGSYISEEKLEIPYKYPNGNEGVWYCCKAVLRFADGKIVGMEFDFRNMNDEKAPIHTYRLYNVGTSKVEVPQSILDSARPESMQSIDPVMQQNAGTVQDASAWDAAFGALTMTNYSMTIVSVYSLEGHTQAMHGVFTEDAVYYYNQNSGETYVKANGDGTNTYYQRPYGGASFAVSENNTEGMLTAIAQSMVTYLPTGLTFDKFTYDAESKSYVCEDVLALSITQEGSSVTIYGYKTVVQFVDGKISTVMVEYRRTQDTSIPASSISYFNIGSSVVEIPQEVIDNAQPAA